MTSRIARRLNLIFGSLLLGLVWIVAAHVGGDDGALLAFLGSVCYVGAITLALLLHRRNSMRQAALIRSYTSRSKLVQRAHQSMHVGLIDPDGVLMSKPKPAPVQPERVPPFIRDHQRKPR